MSVFRLIAQGFGIKLPEPKEKPLPPGFRGIHVNNIEGITHDPPEPGGLPAPTKPPPKPGDAYTSVKFPGGGGATFVAFPDPVELSPWPAGRPRYGVDYLGGSTSDVEPPKKKPDRQVPLLDAEYFEEKQKREYYTRPPIGFSASNHPPWGATSGYGVPSYYAHATGGIIMHEAAVCRQSGHDFIHGRCYRCFTPER